MTTVVVFTGKDNDRQLRSSPTLPPYTATEVAGFTVYVFDRQVPVDQLPRWTY
jgi:hypothetical protein